MVPTLTDLIAEVLDEYKNVKVRVKYGIVEITFFNDVSETYEISIRRK